jgi:ABC-type transport system involved in multi-copper enzyme maturation permease subunit
MGFLGMLRDSLRESLDRRSLVVILILSTLFILICACIGYESVDLDKTLNELPGKLAKAVGGNWGHQKIEARFEISEIRKIGREPDREAFEGGTSFRVRAYPLAELQKLVLYSRAIKNRRPKEWSEAIPGISEDYKQVLIPPESDDLVWFVGAKLREHNFFNPKVEFEGTEGDGAAFRVWLKPVATRHLTGSWRLNVFFGAMVYDITILSIADVVFFIQNTLSGLIAGWIGILVAIIATAAFIPNMIQKGTIDLLLARPLPRWRVFLYKYLGGLIYVMVTAGYLIGGSWLVIALRSGCWSPGYLLSWPLLIFFFAALYSVSALIGLLTRSTIAAILISAVTWFILSMLGSAYLFVHDPRADVNPDGALVKALDATHAVLPRLKDVDQAILWCQLKGNGITEEHLKQISRDMEYPEVEWGSLFGVTGAWMAALLALACWRFSRRDY